MRKVPQEVSSTSAIPCGCSIINTYNLIHHRLLLQIALYASLIAFVSSNQNTCAWTQSHLPLPPVNNNNPLLTMRAWNCHGRNQKEMVDRMIQASIVKSKEVQQVLYQVDRANYIVPGYAESPYFDAPQSIGLGQTISAPHMHAWALEEIVPYLRNRKPAPGTAIAESKNAEDLTGASRSDVKLLDVGCGSGYLTAALGRWLHPGSDLLGKGMTGKVFGMDIYPHLVQLARSNIMKQDGDLIEQGTVHLQVGDGWKGWPEEAPFDAIHVGAAAHDFPVALMQQLKVGGVLIIPVGPQGGVQHLYKVERIQESVPWSRQDYVFSKLLGVRYVPLVQP